MKYQSMGLCLLLLTCSVFCQQVLAEEKPGAREREALRRSQTQLQTLQKEQAAMQDKLRVADEDMQVLEQRVKDMDSRDRAASAKSKQLQVTLDQTQTEFKNVQAAKTELEQKLARALERVSLLEKEQAQTGAQLKSAQGVLSTRNQQIGACEKRNTALYGLGRKVVAQCSDNSPAKPDDVLQRLSGSKRADFETLLEEFRDKLDAERMLASDLAQ